MRMLTALAAVAALGLAACTQAETNQAEADAERARAETSQELQEAGAAARETAHELGEATEAAVNEAAGAIERATDDNEQTEP